MKDGGPAFPGAESVTVEAGGNKWKETEFHVGMSLRDHFAESAMRSLIERGSSSAEVYARESYRIADAMLKERMPRG